MKENQKNEEELKIGKILFKNWKKFAFGVLVGFACAFSFYVGMIWIGFVIIFISSPIILYILQRSDQK